MIYIIIILVALFIIMAPFYALYFKIKEKVQRSSHVSSLKQDSPQKLYQDAIRLLGKEEADSIDREIAASKLIAVAERGHQAAMLDLLELTSDDGQLKDISLHQKYVELFAQKGFVPAIVELFGISDISMGSKDYDRALACLAKAKGGGPDEDVYIEYYKGVVTLEKDDAEKAAAIFESIDMKEAYALSNELCGAIQYLSGLSYEKMGKFVPASQAFAAASEMEGGGYAEAQKRLWEYYSHGREGVPVNLLKSAYYGKQYYDNDDSDKDSAAKALGWSYHNIAVKIYGKDSVSRDDEKAISSYEAAAILGEYNSRYVVALCSLQGRYESVLFPYNYNRACDYLSDVATNSTGSMQEAARDILAQYAVEDILVIPVYLPELHFALSGGYELSCSKEGWQGIYIINATARKRQMIVDQFNQLYYEHMTSFGMLMARIEKIYSTCLMLALMWGTGVLLKFGIDIYDAEALYNLCTDRLALEDKIPAFLKKVRRIEERASELQIKRAYSQAGRGQWIGGGFGIEGAIKGAVGAGVLNAASGAVHSLGDGIIKSMNNSEINSLEEKLFKDPATCRGFESAVTVGCTHIFNTVALILSDNGLALPDFEVPIVFRQENLGEFNDRELEAKQKSNAHNPQYRFALLTEMLRRDYNNTAILQEMLDIANEHDKKVIERFASVVTDRM
ncbi:hypothetical protein U6B65_13450 [Oscillospiraceae bacterium MB08-C2-2]|nr:hypothetical protein U6B65_13450 [Oscillospiraceae bacterium MB08-C2-2]